MNDFMTVKANIGRSGMLWTTGDFDGDGDCDWDDLSILRSNFGAPSRENLARQ